jgi:hypothetical protein
MSVPELVPDNRVLSLAIEISLIAVVAHCCSLQ